MERILLIEDDPAMAAMISEYLGLEGFHVDAVHDGAAPAAEKPIGYDLVVLDVMLPNRSGFDVLRSLRKDYDTPVILLTARDNETDCVVGLELGADDYVTKPFKPRELVARIRAVLRRTERASPDTAQAAAEIRIGDVWLNPAARLATRGGRELDLTTAEFDLLQHLLLRAGMPVSRDELAQASLGRSQGVGAERNIDTLVSKLRRKLGPDDLIKTVRNVGYLYVVRERAVPG
ncbi:MAG TPA: response regulator transcription factor [Acetobacteraceae bacterium]|nr:response regulator transcription factor [Acetobacteraceae bacterium]